MVQRSRLISRSRDLDARSGECCVFELIASTYIGQMGAIQIKILAKPAAIPKNIELNRMEFRIWLVLTEHDGRFSAKASDSLSGTDTGTGF